MTIGEKIQEIRVEKGLTQERLAEMLDVSRQSVSKWELGQAVPDVDKIVRMSELFDVSTDTILLRNIEKEAVNHNPLHLGSICLVVKDFEKSAAFYEKFFGVNVSDRCRSGNKLIEFYIDNKCISLMNEENIKGHCTSLEGDYKFVQNYWVEDLQAEHERVKALQIGEVTEILEAYPTYHFFHMRDPDNNVIEVTGGYTKVKILDVKIESCPAARFIGKKYDGFGNWGEWQTNNLFAELAPIQALPINNDCYIGAMHVVNGMVEYWIGRFYPLNTAVPKGFVYVDIEPLNYAVFRLYGNEKNDKIFSFDTHNMCLQELKTRNLIRKEDDWCFQRHNYPKHIVSDDKENVILEYAVSIEK